jgi:hypothetical protein
VTSPDPTPPPQHQLAVDPTRVAGKWRIRLAEAANRALDLEERLCLQESAVDQLLDERAVLLQRLTDMESELVVLRDAAETIEDERAADISPKRIRA